VARVVVVGASMGGLRAAEAVAKHGFTGEVVVIGDERHMPYNRPPLSKEALAGEEEPDHAGLAFRIPRHAREVTWRLGHRVVAADLGMRTVTLESGERLAWDGLVVATGLEPRRLDLPGPLAGRHVVRTLDDAQALRAALVPGARVVVVGAGFIGCEAAATARALGASVDVVAPESVPMQRPLGLELGAALQRRHEVHGVRFHLGRLPALVEGGEEVEAVVLDDGTRLPADVLVEAIGCAPNTGWLEGNGLDLSDGVLCDNALRAVGEDGAAHPDVVACGDIARFPNLLFDDVPRRVEHWTMVSDTAKHAGATLAAHLTGEALQDKAFGPVPSFWSDQYDMRLQSFGSPALGGDDIRVLEGDLDGEVAVGYQREGRLVGVVLVGLAARFMHYRGLIAEGALTPVSQ
jgi:NADPH-dependent 2,4-dienoyl-CoA reductase/sulfur reductase-like enzyme